MGEAIISACGNYRYRLGRQWLRLGDDEPPLPLWDRQVVFVMLNPSTADADTDDPTIRRCVGFAKRWGYGGLWAFNVITFLSGNDLLGAEKVKQFLQSKESA